MKNFSISNHKLQVLLHTVAWVIIIIIPQYVVHAFANGNTNSLYHVYLYTAIYGSIFYINYLMLVPFLFLRGKRSWYFLATAFTIIIFYFLFDAINTHYFFDPERERQIGEVMKKLAEMRNAPRPPIKQFMTINFAFTSILVSGFALGLGVLNKLDQN